MIWEQNYWIDTNNSGANIESVLRLYTDGSKQLGKGGFGAVLLDEDDLVLQQTNGDYSREAIMKSASNIKELRVPMLLPGITIDTSPTDFFPIEAMALARIKGQTWERFGDVISAESE